MLNLNLDIVIQSINGKLTGLHPRRPVTGISTDGRTVQPGDLFFALKGERFDGHDFVKQALAKGAVGAVVSRVPNELCACSPLIQVEDTLVAYGDLASCYRSLFDIPFIAVTGSVGKTTAKEMTARVLETRFNTLRTEANFNNEIGVPKTLFQLTAEHQAAVIEMAMRASGEIRRLAEITRPNIALITNIGISHIERLGSQDAIAEAKAEVFEFLSPDGWAILNADDHYFEFLQERSPASVISFGIENSAEVSARNIEATDTPGVRFIMQTPIGAIPIELSVPGRHNVMNALSAAGVGLALDLDLDSIREGLESYTPGAMRLEILNVAGIRILSDCYNASPASMAAALDVLRNLPDTSQRFAVLGDMKELGTETESAHKQVGDDVSRSADWLITVGDFGRLIAEGALDSGMPEARVLSFDTNAQALGALVELIHPGDAILVKGSRAMQMEEIVKGIGG